MKKEYETEHTHTECRVCSYFRAENELTGYCLFYNLHAFLNFACRGAVRNEHKLVYREYED